MKRRLFSQRMYGGVLTLLVVCGIGLPAAAVSGQGRVKEADKTSIKISNFGRVNDHIYRGEQPKGDDYRELVALGVKTIVDLRGDNERDAQASAERAGLRYINLPLAPKRYPQADVAQRFLAIVNDQANWPVYVHCAGGRHRTGALLAVYHMEMDGWDIGRAYQEMKDYDYYTRMGHGCYKDYVYDYSRNLQARNRVQSAPSANSAVTAGQRY
jgi:protein tyrosine/serine phosphatase